jgi:diguanylate cyclase (GGDEF)-like protein
MGQRPTVGVLIPHVGGRYFSTILTGIQRAACGRGARVVAFQTAGMDLFWPEEEETLPLGWDRIDGWIGINDAQGASFCERIAAAGKPLVTIRTRLSTHRCCTALADNGVAMREVVGHLIDHGHSRIAFTGALTHNDTSERYEEYIGALRDAHITPDSSLFFPTPSTLHLDGRAVGKQLAVARPPCTAVIAAGQAVASGILEEVQAAGYRVPEDLAVVGFDDVDGTRDSSPVLTAVRLRGDALAEKATEALLSQVIDGVPLPEFVRVAGGFVRSSSCGCSPPQGSVEGRPAQSNESENGDEFESAFVDATSTVRSVEALLARADANRKVSLALTGTELTAKELSWLRWTRVRHGMLGEWRAATTTTPRRLCIRNTFHAAPGPSSWQGSEHLPAQFPTRELCDLIDESQAEIMSVVPILGNGQNRGLLTVVGPVEVDPADDAGDLTLWAALLRAAMDREELGASLRLALEREHEFVATLRQNEEQSQSDLNWRKNAEAELRRVDDEIRRHALHDALTGLPNRALLMDRLEQAIARAQRAREARFAVLFLDLDHFKTINDSLGHLAGDQLLVQIAQRLSECLRTIDTVARLGGDEFAIIVADLEDDDVASLVAERIQDALRAPFDIGGHRVFTSASVGITLSSDRYQRAEDFLREADTAMYRAKSLGRARHQFFDGHMHEQAMQRLRLESGVRRALEREEFVLHYQPIVSLAAGEVVGVEALIRWNHPERGLLAPAQFLDVAEESGLILPISEWVVRSACEQASFWLRDLSHPMRVSINLPPRQLKDPSLVKLITYHLARTGLPAWSLGLELIESSLIENREAIVDNLRQLRAMGAYIAVDDFGTGYSSLSYLKRLPIDALKIDRSFTLGIPSDVNDTAISSTIIAMARTLHLNVVAEGVETREQVEFLSEHGCQMAQGYLFSAAVPAQECEKLFTKKRFIASTPSPPPRRAASAE